jgi:hypothetical protein
VEELKTDSVLEYTGKPNKDRTGRGHVKNGWKKDLQRNSAVLGPWQKIYIGPITVGK